MLEDAFAAIRGEKQIEMFFDDVRDVIILHWYVILATDRQ